jgi:hypothetical protein
MWSGRRLFQNVQRVLVPERQGRTHILLLYFVRPRQTRVLLSGNIFEQREIPHLETYTFLFSAQLRRLHGII